MADFDVFKSVLKENQTLVGVHLFGHGRSAFPEDRSLKDSLRKAELIQMTELLLQEFSATNFSLLAYSLGGKIALMLTELYPERIKNLLLIAPDGVKINKLYKFSSGTSLGRAIYRFTLNNPKPLFFIADSLKWLRLLTPKLHKFTHYHMETYEKRKMVGDVWMVYRFMTPNIETIQHNINNHSITTVLVYGEYDRVIQKWQGEKLNAGLDDDALHILDAGHLLLTSETIDYLATNELWMD